MDPGADGRGVDVGPSAIRYAGLDAALEDLGNAVTDAWKWPCCSPRPGLRIPGRLWWVGRSIS